jgi:hypothetical protein
MRPGWTDARKRKLRWFVATGVIIAFVTAWAAGQVWAVVELPGQAATSSTGWQLVEASQVQVRATVGTVTLGQPAVPAFFGVPAVTFLTAVAALLLSAGALSRNAIICGLAVVPWLLLSGMRSMTHTALMWQRPADSVESGMGLNVTEGLGPLLLIVTLVATIYVAKTNHDARKASPGPDTSTAFTALAGVFRMQNRGMDNSVHADKPGV